jgi:predicted TIM-barrel fold metal-dependent hydrolase
MEIAAAQPNVAVKISGLGQPGRPWTLEANGPIIRATVGIFGADRCLFASNYPVDSLVASYDTIVKVMGAALEGHSPEDRARIFSGNAVRLYRLKPVV